MAAHLCPPIDGVTTSVAKADALGADIVHARRPGFTGKLCIHPAQVPAVTTGFAPTEDAATAPRPWPLTTTAGATVSQLRLDRLGR